MQAHKGFKEKQCSLKLISEGSHLARFVVLLSPFLILSHAPSIPKNKGVVDDSDEGCPREHVKKHTEIGANNPRQR